MEEKERYKLESHNGTFCDFHDTETDEWYTRKDLVTDLLNQQDKRIKELEEENNFLEKRNEELIIDRRDFCLERNDIFEENQQLKQSQNQIAIEELEKLKEEMVLNGSNYCEIRQGTSPHNPSDYYAWFNYVMFRKFIDNRIKKLKGVDKDE